MNIINLVRIALRALQRNKLRAFLTMLGIIIGVGAVIAMVAIGQGSKKSIQDQISAMGSNMITVRPNSNVTVGGGETRLDATNLQTLTLNDITGSANTGSYSTQFHQVYRKGQVVNGALNWPTGHTGSQSKFIADTQLEFKRWRSHLPKNRCECCGKGLPGWPNRC